MAELSFDSKGNNNRRREQEFLSLSGSERVMVFLKSFAVFSKFPIKDQPKDKGNFVLQLGKNGI